MGRALKYAVEIGRATRFWSWRCTPCVSQNTTLGVVLPFFGTPVTFAITFSKLTRPAYQGEWRNQAASRILDVGLVNLIAFDLTQ
ncbi:hypothetical protein LshimejAT787_1102090 [Lyophyllum shimeji]|uniref:Uncharacterized protein n=1 Tax=Lyophyllum shimeji TaxID=47721 RepID=A0A9P3PVC6_LYOSH|nr:hypothetical protein LshimejAT787_1102090 [Lyophyllum shimeji]